ncbi:lipase, partial [Enterococcus cecorum]|nr:lipase [Enterococcus cecorum]
TQMQEIVTNWNDASQQTVATFKKVYFIPINDVLFKGDDSQVGIVDNQQDQTGTTSSTADENKTQTSKPKAVIVNELLSDEDRFHPNNVGYQLMAKAVMDELSKTKTLWYPEVGD